MTDLTGDALNPAHVELETAPMTSRTRVALAIARALAAGHGHDDVSAMHILLGLVREGENAAVATLEHGGVPLAMLRGELERRLPPPERPRAFEVALGVTSGERAVLRQAEIERRSLKAPPLAPEHLLLAVLHDGTSPASRLLGEFGVRHETALSHVAAVVHYHG